MNNIDSLKLVGVAGKTPVILASTGVIAEIKEIVRVAPHEAQWFYTVERVEANSYWGYILKKLFIPEQFVGSASVETQGYQQIAFYKELKEIYNNDLTKVNEVLQSMSCWCHSHGNLDSPRPSSTDRQQFKELKEAFTANKSPIIMLIFTKEHNYFSCLYDPERDLTFEGIKIQEYSERSKEIEAIAKVKFKAKSLIIAPKQTIAMTGSFQRQQQLYNWQSNCRQWWTPQADKNTTWLSTKPVSANEENEENTTDNPKWNQIHTLYSQIQDTKDLTETDRLTEKIKQLTSDRAIIIADILLNCSSDFSELLILTTDQGINKVDALFDKLYPQAVENITCGVWFSTDFSDALIVAEELLAATTHKERITIIESYIDVMAENTNGS